MEKKKWRSGAILNAKRLFDRLIFQSAPVGARFLAPATKIVYDGSMLKFLLTPTLVFIFPILTALAQTEPPPRLFIITPSPGEVIYGDTVNVIVDIPSDITLVDPETNQEKQDGEGHLHLWLDASPLHDETVSVTPPERPEYTYTKVFSGLHTLSARLYHNDHTPYEPRLSAKVEFETVGEELKPARSRGEDAGISLNDWSAGLFLPSGRGNTAGVVAVLVILIGALWYFFGRKKK